MVDYTSSENVLDYLNWTKQVPDHDAGVHTSEVSDSSGTLVTASTFYTSNSRLVSGTEVVYYGTSDTDKTALTKGTNLPPTSMLKPSPK